MSRRAKVFVNSITSAGLPVGTGDIKTLDFPAGGISESSPGIASINVVGATGQTGSDGSNGSQGIQGIQGIPGPAGPGFTSYNSNFSAAIDIPNGPISVNFTSIGFNWRMASAACAQVTESGGTDGIYVRSITGLGSSTVQVALTGVDANANAILFRCWYQASG